MTKPKTIDPRLGEYVHIDEFARMVNMTRRTINRWIFERKPNGLPHIKVGRGTYVPLDSAREWIAHGRSPHLRPTRRAR